MALSQDLPLRIVNLVACEVSRREAARQFKVSTSSAVWFVKQANEVGHVDVKKPKQRRSIRVNQVVFSAHVLSSLMSAFARIISFCMMAVMANFLQAFL